MIKLENFVCFHISSYLNVLTNQLHKVTIEHLCVNVYKAEQLNCIIIFIINCAKDIMFSSMLMCL